MDMIQELKVFAKHQKVLLVEDDVKLNQQTARLLKNFFPIVRRAHNGSQAMDMIKREKYDLIITDIRMPEMDGIELSKIVKEKNPRQAIIVMSAYEESKYFIDLINLGIDGFILKPYELDTFLKTILRICENEAYRKEFEKEKIRKIVKALSHQSDTQDEAPKTNLDRKLDTLVDMAITKITKENKSTTTASDMLEDISHDDGLYLALKQAINEFMDLNSDFEDVISNLFLDNVTTQKIQDVANVLKRYYLVFLDIEAFEDVANILNDLSKILQSLDVSTLNNENKQALEILEFIQQDIKNFIDKIFIEKKAKDINYFTDSLKISVNDIEVKLGLKEEEFGDVDFF